MADNYSEWGMSSTGDGVPYHEPAFELQPRRPNLNQLAGPSIALQPGGGHVRPAVVPPLRSGPQQPTFAPAPQMASNGTGWAMDWQPRDDHSSTSYTHAQPSHPRSLPGYSHPPASMDTIYYSQPHPMAPPPMPPPDAYRPAATPTSAASSRRPPNGSWPPPPPTTTTIALRPPTEDHHTSVSASSSSSSSSLASRQARTTQSLEASQPEYSPPPSAPYRPQAPLRPQPLSRSVSTPAAQPPRPLPAPAISALPPPPAPVSELVHYAYDEAPGLDEESDSSYATVDVKHAPRTRVATQKVLQSEADKQARRREQNRAAQRAYKARQNKHVEEVEIRNRELEAEIRQQRDKLQNMTDLMRRVQRENDVLKDLLEPAFRPQDEQPTSPDSWSSISPAPPVSAIPSSRSPFNQDRLSNDALQQIVDAFAIRQAVPPAQRTMPGEEARRANELAHVEHLRERYKWYHTQRRAASAAAGESQNEAGIALGLSSAAVRVGLRMARSQSAGIAEGVQPAVESEPEPTTDSPINEDNLQELLGPRYWEYGTKLVPAPPRVPLRGFWREVKTAVPSVQRGDIDVDSLCAALQRTTFCDGVEACIPKPAFRYIVQHLIQPSISATSTSISSATTPSTGEDFSSAAPQLVTPQTRR